MLFKLKTIQKKLSKSSSLHIILIAILIHFIISISLLHFFISWFFENKSIQNDELNSIEYDKYNEILKSKSKLNLIRNRLISKNEISIDGWWFDHNKFQNFVECSKGTVLNPCSLVFSTDCKSDRIRAMYQFIPIKNEIDLNEIEISLFSKTGKLIELSEERSFGLQMLIQLSNGELDYLNIEFSYDLDEWYKRKAKFNTYNNNLKISQITVMLYCYGYNGKVMFKDVNISPVNRTQFKNLNEKDLISDCKSAEQSNLDNFNLPEYLTIEMDSFLTNENKKSNNLNKVTLVSQVSMDRMLILERTLTNWQGPISLAIHVPVKDIKNGLDQWQLIYLEKKLKLLNLNINSKVVLVISNEKDNIYPINVLRNSALKNVITDYCFLVDADFIPVYDMEIKLERHLNNLHRNQFKNYNLNKLAFVIPAFEYIENQKFDDSIPKTKEEFMQLIFREESIIQPFRIIESIESHRLTNYWKWYISNKPYSVINGVKSNNLNYLTTKPNGFSDKYEPYLVIKKTSDLPLFDERFTGYGMNKVTFITELFASNYSFFVLPDVWITHFSHKNSIYSQEFLQNAHLRLKNRFSRFQFICKLISKYNLTKI